LYNDLKELNLTTSWFEKSKLNLTTLNCLNHMSRLNYHNRHPIVKHIFQYCKLKFSLVL